jgi:hypothetical protein
MNFSFLRACGHFFWSFFSSLNAAKAWLLVKPDLEKLLVVQFLVGDIQPDLPLWFLFAKNPPHAGACLAMDPVANQGANQVSTDAPAAAKVTTKPILQDYAFKTVDFEPVRVYVAANLSTCWS